MSEPDPRLGNQVRSATAFGSWLCIVIAFTVLAFTLSPWFWIGTAFFVGFGIAFLVWRTRARR